MPALRAYADTTEPNWPVVMSSDFMRMSPSGERIMKSSITVNCSSASSTMTNF
jgi:hypothetical protein